MSPEVNSQAGALKAAFEHIRNGDNKAAAQSITREFGDTPSDPRARHLLGLAFLNEPNFSTAVPHLEQAARYAPDQPIIWSHLCQSNTREFWTGLHPRSMIGSTPPSPKEKVQKTACFVVGLRC